MQEDPRPSTLKTQAWCSLWFSDNPITIKTGITKWYGHGIWYMDTGMSKFWTGDGDTRFNLGS